MTDRTKPTVPVPALAGIVIAALGAVTVPADGIWYSQLPSTPSAVAVSTTGSSAALVSALDDAAPTPDDVFEY